MAAVIRNPILPGFHPDPVICRRGEDYYLANSSFQWWPGVPIHHSRDLAHWELLGYALTRRAQLDMERLPDSCGVWAPCLSHCAHDGLFYLVYTNVNRASRVSPLETPNYVVTAADPRGPWSEPVYLNRTGFDPSLFHDDDGRAWLVNMMLGYRPGEKFFSGILLQEYSPRQRRLIGPVTNIFRGTPLGATEGPHLMKRGQYYYLIVAEGGTGYHHAMMMARAKCLAGPYEMHPQNPIMTAWETVAPLQKAGHGNLVETPDGQWYGGFLCGRPNKDKRCVLGRETAIERGQWRDDGWFYFDSPHPRLEVPGPSDVAPPPSAGLRWTDDFDGSELRLEWNTLRLPPEAEVSLAARPGWLRLRGLPLPIETDQRQALVARRVQHPSFEAATLMEYRPENAWQYAGLICWYSHASYYWLRVAWHEGDGAVLELVKRFGDKLVLAGRIPAAWPQYQLRVSARGDDYRFAGSADGRTWHNVGEPQDGSILSDEAAGEFGFAFTGSFVGLAAVDISDQGRQADFDWLDYRGLAD